MDAAEARILLFAMAGLKFLRQRSFNQWFPNASELF